MPSGAGDGNDPGPFRTEQGRHEEGREGEVTEVVGTELEFKPIDSLAVRWGHHPGVVDEEVDDLMIRRDVCGELPDGGEWNKIQWTNFQGGARSHGQDVLVGPVGFPQVAGGHDRVTTMLRQRPGRLKTQSPVGAGHYRQPSRLIRNVAGRPGHELSFR